MLNDHSLEILPCCFTTTVKKGSYRVIWQLTSKCTRLCSYCFTNYEKDVGFSEEQAFDIVLKLKDIGTQNIMLTGGEPTIWKPLPNLISFIGQKGITPSLFTNADRLNDQILTALLEIPDSYIGFSLESHSEEIHDRVRGKGNFQKVMQAIDLLILKKCEEKIKLNIVVNNNNIEHIGKILVFLRDKGLRKVSLSPDWFASDAVSEFSLLSIDEDLFSSMDITAFRMRTQSSQTNLGFCKAQSGYFSILSNGYLAPCSIYPHSTNPINCSIFEDTNKITNALQSLSRELNQPRGICNSCSKIATGCGMGCPAIKGMNDIDPLCKKLRLYEKI